MFEKPNPQFDPKRRKFLTEAALVVASAALGSTTAGATAPEATKPSNEDDSHKLKVEGEESLPMSPMPSKEGLIQKSELVWMSEDAAEFIHENIDKLTFSILNGKIELDGLHGKLTVSGADLESIKEIIVDMADDSQPTLLIYRIYKSAAKNGAKGELLVVQKNKNGEFEHQAGEVR